MPLDQWYNGSGFRSSTRAFLLDNRPLIAELVSADLAGRLQDEELYAGRLGAMRTFALLSLVIWAKINVEGSIPDSGISFSELAAESASRHEVRRHA